METNDGEVYLIKFDDRHYKIGKSKAISKRIKSFKGKKPIVIHSIWSNKPYKLEAYFHKLFDGKRILDELFELLETEVEIFKSVTKVTYLEKDKRDYPIEMTEDEYCNKYFYIDQEEARLEMINKAMNNHRNRIKEEMPYLSELEIEFIISQIMEYAEPLSYSGSLS